MKFWVYDTGLKTYRLTCEEPLPTEIKREPLNVEKEYYYQIKDNPTLWQVKTTSTVKEDKMAEKTLYEINRGDIVSYGYKLAVNSVGQWVMELKGSGDVVAVDKATVTEVIPYTVDIVYQEGGAVYSYFDEKRELQVGDLFINSRAFKGSSQIGRVVGVDTKQKKATVEIKYLEKL